MASRLFTIFIVFLEWDGGRGLPVRFARQIKMADPEAQEYNIVCVKSLKVVNEVISKYEVETRSAFVVYKKDEQFGSDGRYCSS